MTRTVAALGSEPLALSWNEPSGPGVAARRKVATPTKSPPGESPDEPDERERVRLHDNALRVKVEEAAEADRRRRRADEAASSWRSRGGDCGVWLAAAGRCVLPERNTLSFVSLCGSGRVVGGGRTSECSGRGSTDPQ